MHSLKSLTVDSWREMRYTYRSLNDLKTNLHFFHYIRFSAAFCKPPFPRPACLILLLLLTFPASSPCFLFLFLFSRVTIAYHSFFLFRKVTSMWERSRFINQFTLVHISSSNQELLQENTETDCWKFELLWILLFCVILWINWALTLIPILTFWFPQNICLSFFLIIKFKLSTILQCVLEKGSFWCLWV